MHIDDVNAYRRDKEYLMRNEGAHPANRKASYQDFPGDKMPIYKDDGESYKMPSAKKQEHEDYKVVQGV